MILDPTEAERLQAESWKYAHVVAMIVPLKSGRFAILNGAREVVGVIEGLEWALSVPQKPLFPEPTESLLELLGL